MIITTEEAEILAIRVTRPGLGLDDTEKIAAALRDLAAERDQLHRDLKDQECANEMLRRFVDEQRVSRVAVEAEVERLRAQLKGRQWVAKWQESQVTARIRAEAEAERLMGAIDRIDGLNTTEPDEDGNQWAVSDLIHQEIMTARGGLEGGDNADQPNEALKAMQDAERHGTGVLLDGKRVPPEDFFKSPEEMEHEARDREKGGKDADHQTAEMIANEKAPRD